MIRINLLPPELRRGQRSFDPHTAGTIAAFAVAALILLSWCWVHFISIPGAQSGKARLDAELTRITALADSVRKKEAEIVEINTRNAALITTLNRRILWTETLDQMVDLLSKYERNAFGSNDYEVSIKELSIAPLTRAAVRSAPAQRGPAGKPAIETVEATMKVRFLLLGNDSDRMGSYIFGFFRGLNESNWWRLSGFGANGRKPEDKYSGDNVKPAGKTGKFFAELPLEFTRTQDIANTLANLRGGR